MKKEFIKKVKKECIYDTKKYRYVFDEWSRPYGFIKRLPVEYLGTMEARDNWKTIYIFN